ncbi:nicastrin [Oryzias latipes]|uniref:nicastrin n=1 Tax=Oryzias latipes TaxID=8090 RepID=UPI0002A4A043|nr:nicastrin [Oryzias latipes]
MDLLSDKWIVNVVFCLLFVGVGSNSVGNKIYIDLNETFPCVRLLNATHQIGCQSSFGGDVGVVHLLESEENLDWVLSSGPNPPYMVILESTLFTRPIMMKLKHGPQRVAGVVVVEPTTNPPDGFSPHTSCPNENMGVYSESYGPSYAHCNVTVWNPLGNGLSYEEFDFPIFSMKDSNDTEVIRRCYREHNRAVNGSTPQYPLCAMQLFSHMSAVTDTATCMRRSEIPFSLTPEFVCDPLGDENIWASTKPLNNTAKGHKEGESVVIAAVKMDSRSFFFGLAPGADSTATGLVALLAAANALRNATAELNRTILYTFFHGETFDYIGSSRMVYDMENNQFPLDLDNVHSILEVGQVALGSNSRLWLHSDPVSRRNRSVNVEVQKLVSNLHLAAAGLNISLEEPNVTQPLPPSSFQRFLRVRSIPGVVIENHQASFTNKYYQSIFDNAESLQLNYSPNLTAEEQLEFVTDAAKNLTEVATAVARGLYLQAGGHPAGMNTVQADSKLVSKMLYTFLVRGKNSWSEQLVSSGLASSLKDKPTKFYIGVDQEMSEPNFMVQTILANLTGTIVNVTKENCQKQKEDEEDNRNKHLYYYQWVQGPLRPNSTERDSFCVRSTVRKSPAKSPAFVLREYTSKDYSTWTESRWKTITGRIFLVASHDLEMLTLGVGVAVLLVSLLLTYFVSSKADILFSSGREPTNATY